MNPYRAEHFLAAYSQHVQLKDVVEDDMLQLALETLIEDFDHQEHAEKTIGQLRGLITQQRELLAIRTLQAANPLGLPR